jgi:hypothetical protein
MIIKKKHYFSLFLVVFPGFSLFFASFSRALRPPWGGVLGVLGGILGGMFRGCLGVCLWYVAWI